MGQAQRQWLTIDGDGFVLDSEVYFNDGTTTYPAISRLDTPDRFEFLGSSQIRVKAGFGTQPGKWSVQVTNPNDVPSNIFLMPRWGQAQPT